MRDAEKAKHGFVRDVMETALKDGKDPTRAGVKREISQSGTKQSRRKGSNPGRSRPKQTDNKDETIIALHDKGMSSNNIAKEIGVGGRAVRHVIERERLTRAAAANIDPAALSLSAQKKLDAAIRQAKRALDLEFEQRIHAEVQQRLETTILPHYKEKYELYTRVIQSRKGVMDRASYRKILAALHPDRVQDPSLKRRAEEAFNLFTSIERLLLDEKQSPTMTIDMPTTYADLMARRQKMSEARKSKRAAATRH